MLPLQAPALPTRGLDFRRMVLITLIAIPVSLCALPKTAEHRLFVVTDPMAGTLVLRLAMTGTPRLFELHLMFPIDDRTLTDSLLQGDSILRNRPLLQPVDRTPLTCDRVAVGL